MSTSHPLINDDELLGMIADLKKWPHTAIDNGTFELSTTLFSTFYFTYEPANYLQTTLAMIDVKEAFERLLGHPFTIATHPDSERPHPYGSKRLGDLRDGRGERLWKRRSQSSLRTKRTIKVRQRIPPICGEPPTGEIRTKTTHQSSSTTAGNGGWRTKMPGADSCSIRSDA